MRRGFLKTFMLLVAMVLIIMPVCAFALKEETDSPQVGFVPGLGTNPALDPDDPGVEYIPQEGEGIPGQPDSGLVVTGQAGDITLDVVPNLDFGRDNPLTSKTDYPLEVPIRPFVQISDLRGTGEGWELRVSAAAFRSSDLSTSLNSAEIVFEKGEAISSNASLMADENSVRQPTIPSQIRVPCTDEQGMDVLIMKANGEQDAGMGTWIGRWYGENEPQVFLYIPRWNASQGMHTTTITWTLQLVP